MDSPAPTRDWDRVFNQRQELVAREIAGETLLVPVSGKLAQLQQIFSLSPVAAFIWQHLDGERDLSAVYGEVLESFDVGREAAADDLFELVSSLEDAGLILEAPKESS